MAFTSLHTLILLLLSFILISLPPSSPSKPHFSKIFAFGDSYTDTGNTHSITGPFAFSHVSNLPYGTTFFHRSTNRYSDGRLVIDFIATNLSLPFIPPYLDRSSDFSNGINFAVAGSTALNHTFFVNNNLTMDVTPQSTYGENVKLDVQALAIKNIFNFLQALLAKGAKYIVVQGLPLTGCLPLALFLTALEDRDRFGCVANVNEQANSHNLMLQSKLQQLRKQYPKAIISYADYFNAHGAIMTKPTVYGFTEQFKACCGFGGDPYNFDIFATCGSPEVTKACPVPSKFVNWDGVHLTEAVYKVVANMFLHRGYCHPPFDVLLKNKAQGS